MQAVRAVVGGLVPSTIPEDTEPVAGELGEGTAPHPYDAGNDPDACEAAEQERAAEEEKDAVVHPNGDIDRQNKLATAETLEELMAEWKTADTAHQLQLQQQQQKHYQQYQQFYDDQTVASSSKAPSIVGNATPRRASQPRTPTSASLRSRGELRGSNPSAIPTAGGITLGQSAAAARRMSRYSFGATESLDEWGPNGEYSNGGYYDGSGAGSPNSNKYTNGNINGNYNDNESYTNGRRDKGKGKERIPPKTPPDGTAAVQTNRHSMPLPPSIRRDDSAVADVGRRASVVETTSTSAAKKATRRDESEKKLENPGLSPIEASAAAAVAPVTTTTTTSSAAPAAQKSTPGGSAGIERRQSRMGRFVRRLKGIGKSEKGS